MNRLQSRNGTFLPFTWKRTACLALVSLLAPWVQARTPAPGSSESALELSDVIHHYFQANGGRQNVNSMKSVQLSGKFLTEEGAFPFRMIKKRPDRVYLRLELEDYSVITTHDGESVFRMVENPQGASRMIPLSEADRDSFLEDAAFESVLVRNVANTRNIHLKGTTELEGIHCYVIAIEEGESAFEVYLNADTFLEAFMEKSGPEGVTTFRYEDYLQVGGLWIPRLIIQESPLGRQQIQVEQVRVNVGVFDSFFTMEEQ